MAWRSPLRSASTQSRSSSRPPCCVAALLISSADSLVDHAAACDVVGVLLEQRAGELEHLDDAHIRDLVVDAAMLAAADHEAAPAQARQMIRDLRLRLPGRRDQLAD